MITPPLAYYGTELITSVKSLILQASENSILKKEKKLFLSTLFCSSTINDLAYIGLKGQLWWQTRYSTRIYKRPGLEPTHISS
jgi:hypothetical protein